MATRKFMIEVEEGWTNCEKCRLVDFESSLGCWVKIDAINCDKLNLATMKIKQMEETNNDSRTTD